MDILPDDVYFYLHNFTNLNCVLKFRSVNKLYNMKNYIDIIKEHFELKSKLKINISRLNFNVACMYNCNKLATYLYKTSDSIDSYESFEVSCIYGNIIMSKFLYNIYGNDIHGDYGYIFYMSCYDGHINIMQWIYKTFNLKNDDIDKKIISEYVFNFGYFDIIKWLYELKLLDDDNMYKYFLIVCKCGYMDIAKWIYNNYKIDIHQNNEEAFASVCCNGHIEIAKWLYELGDVDIHVDCDIIFNDACKNDRLDIAKWLFQLDGENIKITLDTIGGNLYTETAKWFNKLIKLNFVADNIYMYRQL